MEWMTPFRGYGSFQFFAWGYWRTNKILAKQFLSFKARLTEYSSIFFRYSHFKVKNLNSCTTCDKVRIDNNYYAFRLDLAWPATGQLRASPASPLYPDTCSLKRLVAFSTQNWSYSTEYLPQNRSYCEPTVPSIGLIGLSRYGRSDS